MKDQQIDHLINKNQLLFTKLLSERLSMKLPGAEVQIRMAPLVRIDELKAEPPAHAVKSAVLLLLYPHNQRIHTHVILRSEDDSVHSGQISLPGGRMELYDESLRATALREAGEETGIDISKVTLLGPLTHLYIPRSNFLVYPFVGFSESRPDFKADPSEVSDIIEIDIADLLWKPSISRTLKFSNGFSLEAPGYDVQGHFMWGATAMIFSEFLEILRSVLPPQS